MCTVPLSQAAPDKNLHVAKVQELLLEPNMSDKGDAMTFGLHTPLLFLTRKRVFLTAQALQSKKTKEHLRPTSFP